MNFKYFFIKGFSHISGNGNFLYFIKKVFLIFPEMELSSLKNKKFQEGTTELEKKQKNPEKISYILGNETF